MWNTFRIKQEVKNNQSPEQRVQIFGLWFPAVRLSWPSVRKQQLWPLHQTTKAPLVFPTCFLSHLQTSTSDSTWESRDVFLRWHSAGVPLEFGESWTEAEMRLWALRSRHPASSPSLPRRCQQCPESTAAHNECTPICNDWVITLFAPSTLFWRSGRLHLCSGGNCQAGAASASICILHWGVALQMIMLNCFCNRNVQSNKVNDLERHGGKGGGGRKQNRLKCRCSPSDGSCDGGDVSM